MKLGLGELEKEDKRQVVLNLWCTEKYERVEDEESSIALILCSENHRKQ